MITDRYHGDGSGCIDDDKNENDVDDNGIEVKMGMMVDIIR